MPVRKRKRSRRSRNSFEWERLDILDRISLIQGRLGNLTGPADADGFPVDPDFGLRGVFQTWEDLEEGYETNREILLFLWEGNRSRHRPAIDGGTLPGTRPGSWWRFEAPEQPAILGTINDPDFGEISIYEFQEETLDRLGLIDDHERELLDKWKEAVRKRSHNHRPMRLCECKYCTAAKVVREREAELATIQ